MAPSGKPLVIDKDEAKALFTKISALLEGLSDGRVQIRDGMGADGDGAGRTVDSRQKMTIKERRAARHNVIDNLGSESTFHDDALARLLDGPEPKRQQKERNLPARRIYTLKPTRGRNIDIKALTPASVRVLRHLNEHRSGGTVNELADALELKRKTVENILSLLKVKGLIDANVI